MNRIALFCFLLYGLDCSAQTLRYQKYYGANGLDSHGNSVLATADGGYLVVGAQYDTGSFSSDVLVLKLYPNGDTVWTRMYGDSGYEFGYNACQTGPGYMIAGGSNSPGLGAGDIFSIRINASGDTLQTYRYGGTGDETCLGGTAINVSSEGNYVFAGQTLSYGAGLIDAYLFKTDYTGAVLWSRTYGGAQSEQGGSVIRTSDSGFVWCGHTTSFGSGITDLYLVRTDSLGNMLWSKSYGLGTMEIGFNGIQTSDGGFLLTGMREITPSDYEAIVVKTDSLGGIMWCKQYGVPGSHDWADCAIEIPTGGYLICGRTSAFGQGAQDVMLIRTDVNGDTLWTRAYGNFANDYAFFIMATGDGGYLMCGGGVPPSTTRDHVYIIKTDANGWTGCNEAFAPVNVVALNLNETTPNTIQGSGAMSMIPAWNVRSGSAITNICYSVDVNEHETAGNFIVFPSPADQFVTIQMDELPEGNGRAAILITNSFGQAVRSISNAGRETIIDVSSFTPGIYFCRIVNEERVISSCKFVVE